MTRKIKRGGKVWINIFPDKPITKKPAETRMGSGKGTPEGWVAVVKPGRVMFELAGVPEPLAREAMRLAGHKLPDQDQVRLREGVVGRSEGPRGPRPRRRRARRVRRPGPRQEVFNLRFQHATGQLENTARMGEAKKDLARGLTVARAARHRRRGAS